MANRAEFADKLPPIVVSMGEPAGIGPEIILKAWLARRDQSVPPFFVVGDPQLFTAAGAAMGVPTKTIAAEPKEALGFDAWLPVFPTDALGPITVGAPVPRHASIVVGCIEQAVRFCQNGIASATVTGPIQKATLQAAGFQYSGHTQFIAQMCASDGGAAPEPLMMLEGGKLRVALVTIHVALKDAPGCLTRDGIVRKGALLHQGLARDFGVTHPRIAVAALNPHGGEAGTLGREEIEIIGPAIERLRNAGIDARGPFPADTLFHAEARKLYDAVLCMYHDQALIPLKTLDFRTGVNVTLGLPIVRTSPDHGTALDIAGKGIADESSFIAALNTAHLIAARRADLL